MSWTSSLDQCLWCSFTPLPLTILLIANVSMPSCRPTLRGGRGGRNCPNNAFWDIPPNITEKMSLQITFSCSSDNTLACDCAVFTCKESLLCSNIVLLCSTNLKIITQPHVTSWVYKARVNKKKGNWNGLIYMHLSTFCILGINATKKYLWLFCSNSDILSFSVSIFLDFSAPSAFNFSFS